MSQLSDITIRLTVQLILAQVVKTRRHLEDAHRYIHRLLIDPFEVACATCHNNHIYSLPLNRISMNEEDRDTDKWTVQDDVEASPTAEEVASLDQSPAHVSLRGLRLISPTFRLNSTRQTVLRENCPKHMHEITMSDEISTVLYRLRQSQQNIGIIGAEEVRSFLYASPNCQMSVQIDSASGTFPEHTYSRVDQLLDRCARQYDLLVGCPDSGKVGDLFALSRPVEQEEGSEEDDREDPDPYCDHYHAFDSAIDFPQAPSTLDSAQALAWIDVATVTVSRCAEAHPTYFDWQLSTVGEFAAPKFTSFDLLTALACHPTTLTYYKSRLATTAARAEDHDRNIAAAIHALAIGNPLGSLALRVTNTAILTAKPETVRDNVKLKLLTGGYGLYPREYTRRALVAIGAEGVEDEEDVELREGVDTVFYLRLHKRASGCVESCVQG